MFIWTAIDVNSQLSDIKAVAKQIEKQVSFTQSDIEALPLHISLKISTDVPDGLVPAVLKDIEDIFSRFRRFEIMVKGIELHDTIAWIAMEPNPQLNELHESMNSLFHGKYALPLHKFDSNFLFHSTLFLDSDAKAVKEAFLKIMDTKLPASIPVDKFIIGTSKDGSIGSYSVLKTIDMKG